MFAGEAELGGHVGEHWLTVGGVRLRGEHVVSVGHPAQAVQAVLQHPMEDSGGVSLGEQADQTVDVASRVRASGFRQHDGQYGLGIQQITGQRATQGARDAVSVPVIGIAHPAHALESVGAIPNVSVRLVAE